MSRKIKENKVVTMEVKLGLREEEGELELWWSVNFN